VKNEKRGKKEGENENKRPKRKREMMAKAMGA